MYFLDAELVIFWWVSGVKNTSNYCVEIEDAQFFNYEVANVLSIFQLSLALFQSQD